MKVGVGMEDHAVTDLSQKRSQRQSHVYEVTELLVLCMPRWPRVQPPEPSAGTATSRSTAVWCTVTQIRFTQGISLLHIKASHGPKSAKH